MIRAFKFRLYPSRKQRKMLEQTLDTCRILYNNSLGERRGAWEKEKRSVSYYEQKKALLGAKQASPSLRQVHSQVLQDVILRVDKSFKNFFNRIRAGEKPGYPRFKSNDHYDSFTYPQKGFKIEGKKLALSKIGAIDIMVHRPIRGKIKTCTIKKDVGRWYVCFTVELLDVPLKKKEIQTGIGIDVGLSSLITLSTGEKIEPPRLLLKFEEKLAKEQRRLSRKKKGSNNWEKQRLKVAKLHRKIREQRADFSHKLARMFVNTYDLIVFEDLQIKNMLQNHHLAKSIADASWYQLQRHTTYKAEEVGKTVVFVEPNGTPSNAQIAGPQRNWALQSAHSDAISVTSKEIEITTPQ